MRTCKCGKKLLPHKIRWCSTGCGERFRTKVSKTKQSISLDRVRKERFLWLAQQLSNNKITITSAIKEVNNMV